MRLAWTSVVALGSSCAALAACSSAGTTSSAGGSSATTNASASTTGNSTGATGASTGTGGGYVAPPVPAACGMPTATASAMWNAATGEHFWGLRAAWGGKEAALAYAESVGAGFTIKLQRLTEAGATNGAAISLGTSKPPTNSQPKVALATDGTRYIVCWDFAEAGDHVDCAAVGPSSGMTAGLSATGQQPSIAFGADGWALAYSNGNVIALQKLGSDANAVGGGATPGSVPMPNPELVATTSGYALVAGGNTLFRIDGMLHSVGLPSHPGLAGALPGVAAFGDTVGLGWVGASGDAFTVIPATNIPSSQVVVNGGMGGTYSHVAAAAGASSFAVVWSDTAASVGYRAVDGSGNLVGTVQHIAMTAWDDNPVAITGVGDGFVAAVAAGSGLDHMIVTHLACP